MIVGLDHVSVSCADLDRSLAFYHGLLGIPVRERGVLEGGSAGAILGRPDLSARFADLELGEGRTLELIEDSAPVAAVVEPRTGAGTTHLSLRVTDADAAFDHLREAGARLVSDGPVKIDEPGHWHGAKAFYACDPDGVIVELIQRP